MLNIKEIALKHAREYLTFKLGGRKGLDVEEIVCDDEIYKEIVNELAQQFEALVAEVAKQNEPVSFTNSGELDYLDFKREDSGLVVAAMWKDYDKDSNIALFTYPPTAEQIANETAEACAKFVSSRSEVGDYSLYAINIRSGAWKEFKK